MGGKIVGGFLGRSGHRRGLGRQSLDGLGSLGSEMPITPKRKMETTGFTD